ncbi:MAG: DUF2793 domain-containing protein [Gemmobacter sp.]|nr:DUF2793 domain-containing protein [Gemmobacter sp.]
MTETTRLDLPLLVPSQAQKHVTVNETVQRLDGLVQAVVQDAGQVTPPGAPVEGQVWIVATGAVNGWAGWDGDMAMAVEAGWLRLTAPVGTRVWDLGASVLRVRLAAGWQDLAQAMGIANAASLGSGVFPALGIGAATDATNKFVFRGTNMLMDSPTSIDVTLNKSLAGNDASLSFKNGFSPRALIGLMGNDDLTVKVGDTMREAVRINHRSGRAVFRRVQNGLRPFDVVQRRHVAESAWKPSVAAVGINGWQAICWSPELAIFCAISSTGVGDRVMTSRDGVIWTARVSAADHAWQSVCWSPELGRFCAVGSSGTGQRVMTSPDGITWTIRTSAADNDWRAVCWAPELGLFCAVGSSGTSVNRVMVSPDGVTWSLGVSALNLAWRSVCWAPELGLFCAVASSGTGNRVMTSPDGVNWTLRSVPVDNGWREVCWAPELGLFCAVAMAGLNDRVMTSPDGANWTIRASSVDNAWNSVIWAPELGLFAAVASTGAGNRVMTSPDAIVWTTRASAEDNGWQSVTWAPQLRLFAAVASTSGGANRVMTSVSGNSFSWRA